jgi:hypothetical protein
MRKWTPKDAEDQTRNQCVAPALALDAEAATCDEKVDFLLAASCTLVFVFVSAQECPCDPSRHRQRKCPCAAYPRSRVVWVDSAAPDEDAPLLLLLLPARGRSVRSRCAHVVRICAAW